MGGTELGLALYATSNMVIFTAMPARVDLKKTFSSIRNADQM
jgi:hypothetical protein